MIISKKQNKNISQKLHNYSLCVKYICYFPVYIKLCINCCYFLREKQYAQDERRGKYERIDGPNFEIYGGDKEYGYIELWYPIKPIE